MTTKKTAYKKKPHNFQNIRTIFNINKILDSEIKIEGTLNQ